MVTKNNRNYVSGPKLHQALVDWYESGQEEIPFVIVDAIMQICERLATKNNFRNYTYIDEMIASALENCISAVQHKKYDPEKSENPFAYFTQIAYNEFRRVINEEKKQTYIKHVSFTQHVHAAELNGENIEVLTDDSGRLEKLIDKFEKKS